MGKCYSQCSNAFPLGYERIGYVFLLFFKIVDELIWYIR